MIPYVERGVVWEEECKRDQGGARLGQIQATFGEVEGSDSLQCQVRQSSMYLRPAADATSWRVKSNALAPKKWNDGSKGTDSS